VDYETVIEPGAVAGARDYENVNGIAAAFPPD
jgi:hypothetical protein